MEPNIYSEKLKISTRQKIGLAIWLSLTLIFVIIHMAWYFVVLVGLILCNEAWNLFNRLQTSYILTLDNLILKVRNKEVLVIPLNCLQEVHRGTFRTLLRLEVMKDVPAGKIQAIPKLGGAKEIVLIIYEAEGKRAVFIQPSLALLLVLEEGFELPN